MKTLLIEQSEKLVRVGLMVDHQLQSLYVSGFDHDVKVGDIFLGRIADVHKGLQGVFVDIGTDSHGFLHKNDIVTEKEDNDQGYHVGDKMIVQVKKLGTSGKGPLLSQWVSLAQESVIYLPMSGYVAVSHRIENDEKKMSLKAQLIDYCLGKEGAILRTAAEFVPIEQIIEDFNKSRKVWQTITQLAKTSTPPMQLFEEDGFIDHIIKDFAYESLDEVIVNRPQLYQRLVHTFKGLNVIINQTNNLFTSMGVEKDYDRATRRRVWLDNGANIVIEPTEALTVIDINTGHYKGTTSWNDTALQTNLTAVQEIARQLRLRQIGGLVVIDLINMSEESDYQAVLEVFQQALALDRVTTKIGGITSLGLLELTRKKVPYSLQEYLKIPEK